MFSVACILAADCATAREAQKAVVSHEPLQARWHFLRNDPLHVSEARGGGRASELQNQVDDVMDTVLRDVANLPDARPSTGIEEELVLIFADKALEGSPDACRMAAAAMGPMMIPHNMAITVDVARNLRFQGPYMPGRLKAPPFPTTGTVIFKNFKVEAIFDRDGRCTPAKKATVDAGTVVMPDDGRVLLYTGNAWRVFDGETWATVEVPMAQKSD